MAGLRQKRLCTMTSSSVSISNKARHVSRSMVQNAVLQAVKSSVGNGISFHSIEKIISSNFDTYLAVTKPMLISALSILVTRGKIKKIGTTYGMIGQGRIFKSSKDGKGRALKSKVRTNSSKSNLPSMQTMMLNVFKKYPSYGESLYGLKKSMIKQYGINMAMECGRIKACLKQLVESGKLVQTSGYGANGYFRLATSSSSDTTRRQSDVKTSAEAIKASPSTNSYPSMTEMIISAFDVHQRSWGMSLKELKEHIGQMYGVDLDIVSSSVNNCLRSLLQEGEVVGVYGIGLNGSFKLRDESTIKAKSPSPNYIRAKTVSFKVETSMRDMIVGVLGAVNTPGGSSTDVIKKYIAAVYDVHEKSLNTESFHTTLDQAVSDGVVVQTLAAPGPNQSFR